MDEPSGVPMNDVQRLRPQGLHRDLFTGSCPALRMDTESTNMTSVRKALHIASASLMIGAVFGYARPQPAGAHPIVDIAVANWKFTPAKVEAHVGEKMTIRFTSSEGVHGVESTELGIAKTTIPPEKVTEVSFTPKKPGTYIVHCAVLCGEGHDKMMLTIEVKS